MSRTLRFGLLMIFHLFAYCGKFNHKEIFSISKNPLGLPTLVTRICKTFYIMIGPILSYILECVTA